MEIVLLQLRRAETKHSGTTTQKPLPRRIINVCLTFIERFESGLVFGCTVSIHDCRRRESDERFEETVVSENQARCNAFKVDK